MTDMESRVAAGVELLSRTQPGWEHRDADGLAGRLDRLRVLGNGCVPQQVAAAVSVLARRAGISLMGPGDGAD